MSRRDRKDEHAGPPVSAPVANPETPQSGAQDAPAPPGDETGLTGVDAEPLPPATREELESIRRERDELKEQLLRRRAEFENYRKRVDRDRQQAGTDAVAAVLQRIVPALDNLDRALEAGGSEASVREGVELTRRELLSILESQGVTVDDPQGQPFDPQRHQALAHEAMPGFPEGSVVEVYRKGYSYRDRLLRPALVKVAKGEGSEPEKVH
jgi:molecular chaperone GrpE